MTFTGAAFASSASDSATLLLAFAGLVSALLGGLAAVITALSTRPHAKKAASAAQAAAEGMTDVSSRVGNLEGQMAEHYVRVLSRYDASTDASDRQAAVTEALLRVLRERGE